MKKNLVSGKNLSQRDESGRFVKGHKSHQYWLGKKRPNLFSEESIEKLRSANRGEKAYNYKGSEVSYAGLHAWVRRWRGTPKKCERCGSQQEKRYEWANKSGKYLRDLSDWERLCKKCHGKSDDIYRKAWSTKRQRVYPKVTPWNKGNKKDRTRNCEECGSIFNPPKNKRRFCSNRCSSIVRMRNIKLQIS